MKKNLIGYSLFNAKKDNTEYVALHFTCEMRNVTGLAVEQVLIKEPNKYHEDFTRNLLLIKDFTKPIAVDIQYNSKGWLDTIEFIR